jgi:hypothetical protein
MIQQFRMKRDDTGSEYTLKIDCDLLLSRRKKKRGPIKPGDKFTFESRLDGSKHTETLLKIGKTGATHGTGVFVMKSDELGINPDDRVKHMKADAELGCPIEYDEAGRAVFRSKGQYKRYAESHGFYSCHGKGGSYSDPQKLDARERDIRGLPQISYEEEQPMYIPGLTTEDQLPY